MEYTHYKEIRAAYIKLWYQKKYSQISALIDYAMERFPEYYDYAAYDRLDLQIETEDYQGGLDTIENIHRRGYACPPYLLDQLKTFSQYQKMQDENDRLIAQARVKATMKYDVHLPAGYTDQDRYPLFLVLHGDGPGGNNEYQSWYWEPHVMLNHSIIAVYVQSSQVYSPGHFAWLDDYSIAKKDIKNCYDQISAQYSIDPANIYMGGYSGGAIMATEVVLANDLPIKGWVALCPEDKPPAFTRANLLEAMKRGVKGVFMEGELKALLPDEQEMVDMFQEIGFPYELYINEGIGHSFPDDFGEKLDMAISFITRK